jgi:hypothetical protein
MKFIQCVVLYWNNEMLGDYIKRKQMFDTMEAPGTFQFSHQIQPDFSKFVTNENL